MYVRRLHVPFRRQERSRSDPLGLVIVVLSGRRLSPVPITGTSGAKRRVSIGASIPASLNCDHDDEELGFGLHSDHTQRDLDKAALRQRTLHRFHGLMRIAHRSRLQPAGRTALMQLYEPD